MGYWITSVLLMIAFAVYAWYMRHPTVATIFSGRMTLPEREVAALDALLIDARVAPDRVRVVHADPDTPCWSHAYRKWWESKLGVYRRFGRFGNNCIGVDRGQVIGVSLVDTQLADMTPLADLPALRHLQLRDARIDTLAGLPPECRWTVVNLAQNTLTDLTPLARCTELERLDVSFNRLAALPDFKALSRLERLDARQNELTDIAGLTGHPALTWIDLGGNRLTRSEDFADMPQLQVLQLGSNALTSLRGLTNLPALRSVYAYDNQIQTIDIPPDSPVLNWISVIGNPIHTLPEKAISSTPPLITLAPTERTVLRVEINNTPLARELAKPLGMRNVTNDS